MSVELPPEIPQQYDGEQVEPAMPRAELRATGIHVAITVVLAVVSVIAAVLTSGAVSKALILLGPIILFVGAGVLGYRAFASRRAGGRWVIYQGGMWALLLIFLLWVFNAIAAFLD